MKTVLSAIAATTLIFGGAQADMLGATNKIAAELNFGTTHPGHPRIVTGPTALSTQYAATDKNAAELNFGTTHPGHPRIVTGPTASSAQYAATDKNAAELNFGTTHSGIPGS